MAKKSAKKASSRKGAAQKQVTIKTANKSAPSKLTMNLFTPGMTAMHRAGLGGLACSLKYIEKQAKDDGIRPKDLPGYPWQDGQPPWTIESDSITLDFGEPGKAAEFLQKLFEHCFRIQDGAIYLPGQFKQAPSKSILVEAQSAITLTFLQHGQTRKLEKTSTTEQIDVDGDGSKLISFEFKRCESYKHQEGWKLLVDERKGCLTAKTVEVSGPINPGAVVRHVAFTSTTKIEDPVERALPLYFAIVGTLALAVNRGVGVLIVPDVEDLQHFQIARLLMSPSSARDCRVAGASDAVLQCQLRLRASTEMQKARIPACTALRFQSTPWASQQKSRIDGVEVASGDRRELSVFQAALKHFAVRVITVSKPKDAKQAKKSAIKKKASKKDVSDSNQPEYFWSDSVVRPWIAENLARGRPWYQQFHSLMTKTDPVSKKPIRSKLTFEREGLKKMIETVDWKDQGEQAIVLAVHQAIKQRFGQIAGENKGKPGTMKNRMKGEFDKWRLAFCGAKTQAQFRQSICDLFGRAGINPVLKEHWTSILPWLSSPTHWQLARDLSLLALASYTGTGEKDIDASQEGNDQDSTSSES